MCTRMASPLPRQMGQGIECAIEVDGQPVKDAYSFSQPSPFIYVYLPNEAAARAIARRSILVRAILREWASATSYEELLDQIRNDPPGDMVDFPAGKTFAMRVEGYHQRLSIEYQREMINRIGECCPPAVYERGRVNLRSPDVTWCLIEEYISRGPLQRVYFGTRVAEGIRVTDHLLDRFRLNRRSYLGTTAMDPELAFLMANMACSAPGRVVLDPFVGTGSLLLSVAALVPGVQVLGTDIDPRTVRGLGRPVAGSRPGTNALTNFQEIGLAHSVDLVLCDASRSPWRLPGFTGQSTARLAGFVDAIIADPPYGVRESAQQLTQRLRPRSCAEPNDERYILKTNYPPEQVYADLVDFAALHLPVGGRLVYWLAVITEFFTPEDVPRHPAMNLVALCPQSFSRWTRFLVVMEKTREPAFDAGSTTAAGGPLPLACSLAPGAGLAAEDRAYVETLRQGRETSYGQFRTQYFNTAKNGPHEPVLPLAPGEGKVRQTRRRAAPLPDAVPAVAPTAQPEEQ
ncbi:hypothetical protein, variant [Fonticula alba]|uniref:tRNA (guanine(10)-N(2))-methyltransferase n=1 Tax=Fonticula alba TaxID=691883 RepID=A0A058Z5U5_FONAL|nr:hypothetical protein, variant [Fonticula alba]KCV69313.1 hypothetical protein, variant [Fonticula alba]|eukprot:XP_009495878.1 hypothetical protein, variant [Fonticula alba]